MGKKVYANGMEIAHRAGDGKVIAAFPDVCLSPPPPPTGPIPVPYPNTSFAKDLKEGSSSVQIGGKPLALKGQSYYQTSPLGDEAATRNFGGAVITHTITGKTYFQAFSMDVLVEGTNVCRHLDITTSNHASMPGSTPPMPNAETMSLSSGDGGEEDKPKCPCCGGDAHANQVDSSGKLLPKMKEQDYYTKNTEVFTKRRDEMQTIVESGKIPSWAVQAGTDPNPLYNGLPKKDIIINKGNDFAKKLSNLKALRASNKDCPNVHEPADEGCGTHFVPGGDTEAARRDFDRRRRGYLADYKRAHPRSGVTSSSKVNHKTPLDAGGCPTSKQNLIPDPVLTGPCRDIEELQTSLQGHLR